MAFGQIAQIVQVGTGDHGTVRKVLPEQQLVAHLHWKKAGNGALSQALPNRVSWDACNQSTRSCDKGKGRKGGEKEKNKAHLSLLLLFRVPLRWNAWSSQSAGLEKYTQFCAPSFKLDNWKVRESNQSYARFMQELPVFGYTTETTGNSGNRWSVEVTAGQTKP